MKWEETRASEPWNQNQIENPVRQYLKQMEEKEGLSCGYAQIAFSSLQSLFKKNGLPLNLDSNDKPQGVGFGSAVPTHEQVKQVANAVGDVRSRALVLFLKDCGLRVSDVLRLKWEDLEDKGEGYYSFDACMHEL